MNLIDKSMTFFSTSIISYIALFFGFHYGLGFKLEDDSNWPFIPLFLSFSLGFLHVKHNVKKFKVKTLHEKSNLANVNKELQTIIYKLEKAKETNICILRERFLKIDNEIEDTVQERRLIFSKNKNIKKLLGLKETNIKRLKVYLNLKERLINDE
jgi:hypothetical protein